MYMAGPRDPRDEALDMLHHPGPAYDGCHPRTMTLYTGDVVCL